MNQLISANSSIHDLASSFEHYGHIDWGQGNRKFAIGDTVYFYCTKPVQRIQYKCRITKLDLSFQEIRDDHEYWLDEEGYQNSKSGKFFNIELLDQIDTALLELDKLKENALNAAPQSPIKLKGSILDYIESKFKDVYFSDLFPEQIDPRLELTEGLKKQITVNKYERCSIARAKCIEHHGLSCKICGFDFEHFYGEAGKGFIHVHHIKPLHSINRSYKINYKGVTQK